MASVHSAIGTALAPRELVMSRSAGSSSKRHVVDAGRGEVHPAHAPGQHLVQVLGPAGHRDQHLAGDVVGRARPSSAPVTTSTCVGQVVGQAERGRAADVAEHA